MYKKIKKLSLSVLAGVLVASFSVSSVLAQEAPTSVCLRAGTAGSSDYASCVNEIQSGYSACISSFGTGNSEWDNCNQGVVTDFFGPVTPGGDNGGDSDGEANVNGPREEFQLAPPVDGALNAADNVDVSANPIYIWLITVVNFLSVGVGIVVTISVAIAGIQYTISRGDPNKTAAAVNRIVQAGIAIVLYVFGWTLLNWLVPGGVI